MRVIKPSSKASGLKTSMLREKQKAKSPNYISSCDFSHLMLQADIAQTELKDTRSAFFLREAAETIRHEYLVAYLATRPKVVNRPRRYS
jgi:hypothetical protein